MAKITWKPTVLMAPVPVTLVACGTPDKPNVLTVAWTGIVSSKPATTYVSIRPERHSYKLIKQSGCFTINLPHSGLVRTVDKCGVYTGAKMDKFSSFKLTPFKSDKVSAPCIDECPVNLECEVIQEIPLGSHNMFLAEIKSVHIDEELIDEKGALKLGKASLIAYSHGDYMALGKRLGKFGYSVKKKR